MLTRVEHTKIRSADDEPISVAIVYFYEEYIKDGVPHRTITVKAGLGGLLPIEGWENNDDLPLEFHEVEQKEMRASVVRFIELREAHELAHIAEPRILGASRIVEEATE